MSRACASAAAKRPQSRSSWSKLLALDDPRWTELEDAYGRASDAPALLEHLAQSTGPTAHSKEEPWFSLWSKFCHQGSVFSGTYAMVPHVVEIARRANDLIDFSFFAFPAAVEIARARGNGPELPPELAPAYHSAIRQLADVVAAQSANQWSREMIKSAAAALAAAKSDIELADALLNLDNDWIHQITADQ